MKLHINNSIFDIMLGLKEEGIFKTAQASPPPSSMLPVLDIGNSTLVLYPDLKDKIVDNDAGRVGYTIVPQKISKNQDYKESIQKILDSLRDQIASSDYIKKIDNAIQGLQSLKAGVDDSDAAGAGDSPDIPARKRGRPPKKAMLSTAALDLSSLDPSVLPSSGKASPAPSSSPVQAPVSSSALPAEDEEIINQAIDKLENLKKLIRQYEEKFLEDVKTAIVDPANTGKTVNEILWLAKNGQSEYVLVDIIDLVSGSFAEKPNGDRVLGLSDYLAKPSLQKHVKAGAPNASKDIQTLLGNANEIANKIRGQLKPDGTLLIKDSNGKIVSHDYLMNNFTSTEAYDANESGRSDAGLVRILNHPDVRKDFSSFFSNKLTPDEKKKYQGLYDKIQASLKKDNPTPISQQDMDQARTILKEKKVSDIKDIMGDDYGQLLVERQLGISSFIKKIAEQIAQFIESTGPASKATGMGHEAYLNNKGEMVVNGEVVGEDWVNGVRDAIGTIITNLGIALDPQESRLLSGVNPLLNPKHAVLYMHLEEFFNLFSQNYFKDMTWKQVDQFLNENYSDPVYGICEKIMRASEKYKIEYGRIDKPFTVEPNGYVFVKSYKGIKDYVVFKFGPVSSGLYNIGYDELLRFIGVSKSSITNLLKQNNVQEVAEILYKGAMKYAYLQELAQHDDEAGTFTSKFANSAFFNEISNVSGEEILTARRLFRMKKIAQVIGVIKNQAELETQKALLGQLEKAIEKLKQDPSKNEAIIIDRQKKLDLLKRQIEAYEKTSTEGQNFNSAVSAPLSEPQKASPQTPSPQQSAPMMKATTDEEIIEHYLTAIKSLLDTKIDILDASSYQIRKFELQLEWADKTIENLLLAKYSAKLTPEQKAAVDSYSKQIELKLNAIEPVTEKLMKDIESKDASDEDAEEVMHDIEQQIKDREGELGKVVELLEFVPEKKQNIARVKKNLKKYPRIAFYLQSTETGRKFLEEIKHAENLISDERKAFK